MTQLKNLQWFPLRLVVWPEPPFFMCGLWGYSKAKQAIKRTYLEQKKEARSRVEIRDSSPAHIAQNPLMCRLTECWDTLRFFHRRPWYCPRLTSNINISKTNRIFRLWGFIAKASQNMLHLNKVVSYHWGLYKVMFSEQLKFIIPYF